MIRLAKTETEGLPLDGTKVEVMEEAKVIDGSTLTLEEGTYDGLVR